MAETPDHAAALKVLEREGLDSGPLDDGEYSHVLRAALPEAFALYRASVALSAAMTARAQDESDENEQRYYSALIEWDFALAAVAAKLTGEGK